MKLGSLFSGIGGFELVGNWYGIEPVWASEIEDACIRITKKHFPNMKHLGDITKIHGDQIEPVDVITGGSPCQDLSVAGKQSGIRLKCDKCGTLVEFSDGTQSCPNCGAELDFTRSGLFMEQMRIIREMREKTNECFPKIVIWENVLGALSSNNGDDFFCVLQEFCKLVAEKLPSFRPESWSNAGEILGESGSIAWRLFDAQYWGVPQRRRRIFLVADLGGQRAGEILFKSESLRRHLTPSTAPWKRITAKAENSTGESSRNTERYGIDTYNATTNCVSSASGTNCGTSTGRNDVLEEYDLKPICVATQQANAEIMTDVCPTLTAANGTSGSNKPYVVLPEIDEEKPIAFEPGASSRLGGHAWEDVTGTLTSQMGDNQMSVVTQEKPVVYGFCSMSSNSMKSDNPDSGIYEADVSKTLDTNGLNPTCNQGGNAVVEGPVYCIQGNCIDRADTAGCNGKGWREDVSYTLTAMDRPAVAYGLHENQREEMRMIEEKSPCLSTGGGRCGQGLPAVMIEQEADTVLCIDQGGGKSGCIVSKEVSPTLTCTHGGAPAVLCTSESEETQETDDTTEQKAYGVWQNGSNEVGIMDDKTCTLTTGGGKPGQGYPCVLIENPNGLSEDTSDEQSDDSYVAAFAYQQGGSMPSLPYGEKISPPLLSSQKTAVLIENHGQDSRWVEAKGNICPTLSANMGMGGNNTPFVVEAPAESETKQYELIDNHPADSRVEISKDGVCQTLSARMGTGGGNVPLVMENQPVSDETPLTMTCGCFSQWNEDKAATLTARDYKDPQIVAKPKSIVRRLTPLECERLQGYPDGWTASESDSARYKALGNSVALPCVNYIMSGIADVLDPE